jgi:DNA invertase Pin-like site-specific DNA recombinase
VIGYVRVSTLSQVAEGDGLGVQRDRITAFCSYQGLGEPQIEEDAGISGASTDNRPALRRALRMVLEGGPGSVLLVYKLDRLGRNAIDVQEALAVLLDAGVRVVALADGIDSASGMGAALLKLLTGILATFAELEKESIRTRLLDGRRRADQSDRPYASEPRYGRRVAGEKRLEPAADEQAAVARMKELRAAGLSYRAIAAQLLAEGHRPRRAPAWPPIVIQRICTGTRPPQPRAASQRIARARAELLADLPAVAS